MAKIDNGCGGMVRLCNWICTAKELAQVIAERLAERLRLSGIDPEQI